MLSQLHRFLGLALALFLLITSISGALLLWADEYHQWRYPALQGFEQAPAVSASVLEASISNASSPVSTIVLPSEGLPAYYLFHADGSEAFHDATNGAQIAHWQPLETLYSFLFEVHAYLLAGEPGHIIIGIAGLVITLMAVSGGVLWWRRRRVFRLRRWRPKATSAPVLMNAHAAQGVFIGLVLSIVALTGAGMVFHDQAEALLKTIPGSQQITRPLNKPVPGAQPDVHWQKVLQSASASFPAAVPRVIYLPSEAEKAVRIRMKQPDELHSNGRSYLSLHPQTGAIIERIDATQTGPGPSIYNLFYPLHTGKTGWPGNRLALLMVALSSMYLAISGSWVFIRRRRKSRDNSTSMPDAMADTMWSESSARVKPHSDT